MYTSLHLPKKIIQIVSSVYFKVFRLLDPFLFQKKINETLCNNHVYLLSGFSYWKHYIISGFSSLKKSLKYADKRSSLSLSLSVQKITSLQELKHLSCGILKIRCSNHLSKLIEKYFVGFTVSPLYALLKKINKKQTIRRDISMDSVNYGQC